MTQIEKQILIIDLCGRISYGVKVEVTNTQGYHHDNVAKKGEKTIDTLKGFDSSYNCFTVYHNNPLDWDWTCSEIDVDDIKPYLFPISSLTEKQKEEYHHIVNYISPDDTNNWAEGEFIYVDKPNYFEALLHFYNRYHIDYRGLIDKGLALDATNLNIYKDYAEFD